MIHGVNIGQIIVDGLVAGSMYALVACGLSLIWGTMSMLNFAHGEFYMLGGYAVFFSVVDAHLNPFLAVLLALVTTFAIGALVQLVVIRSLLDREEWELPTMVATLGLSIFLQNFALKTFGPDFKNVPYYLGDTLAVFGVRIAEQRVLIVFVAAAAFALLYALLRYTRFGIALRAVSQDRIAAPLVGIEPQRIFLLAFGISVALAALAAAVLAPIYSVNPWMGVSPLLKALAVVVLGGLGSIEGAIVGGLMIGFVESAGVAAFSSEWEDIIAFAALIAVLSIKPAGLFGVKET
jgi:branched-chain amino acid transport system permease protein